MTDSTARHGIRNESVRTANLGTILRRLHFGGPASRSQLVEATGLTRSSVAGLVGALVDAGLVTETASLPDGSPGRPSPLVAANETNAVLAVEIEVDSVAVAIVGLGGTVLYQSRRQRPRSRSSVEDTVVDIAELVAEAREAAPDVPFHGVGIAVAGLVYRQTNTVVVAPNLGWADVPLAALLLEACGLDLPVAVANEGDLAALAETSRGIATKLANVIFLSGEVGVGGGIISDGRPTTGKNGFAGEIGHLPVNPNGHLCGCGAKGCWETEIGERALLRRTGRPVDGGRAALDDVLEAAAAGDADVLQALTDQGEWIGFGLTGLVHVFDPDIIVLGGILRRIYPFVIDAARTVLAGRLLGSSIESIEIVASGLGEDAPLLGAAELAFKPLLADPLRAAAVTAGGGQATR